MRHVPSLVAVIAAGAVASSSPAAAATITFENVVATWSDVQGGTLVSFDGNGTNDATVVWGVPADGAPSGYNFTTLAGPLDLVVLPNATLDFVLGTFTHFNEPIAIGTSITGLQLTIDADVALDGTALGTYAFVFDVGHFETPNTGPCPDGGARSRSEPCADAVTVNYNTLFHTFQVGPDLYTFYIHGFELPNGTPVVNFWTAEGAHSIAPLFATVARTRSVTGDSIGSVPEPATIALFLSGLVGAVIRRRSLRANAH